MKIFVNADLFARQRLDLELVAMRESDYYGKLAQFYAPIRGMTWLTAILIAAGAAFGGMNMLYAAFATRIREIATLQAVGYSRISIFVSPAAREPTRYVDGDFSGRFSGRRLARRRCCQFLHWHLQPIAYAQCHHYGSSNWFGTGNYRSNPAGIAVP